MTIDQVMALVAAVGGVVSILHVFTGLSTMDKVELGGIFAAAAGPGYIGSHNYIVAATAGVAAVGYSLRQRYKLPPGVPAPAPAHVPPVKPVPVKDPLKEQI